MNIITFIFTHTALGSLGPKHKHKVNQKSLVLSDSPSYLCCLFAFINRYPDWFLHRRDFSTESWPFCFLFCPQFSLSLCLFFHDSWMYSDELQRSQQMEKLCCYDWPQPLTWNQLQAHLTCDLVTPSWSNFRDSAQFLPPLQFCLEWVRQWIWKGGGE